MALGFCFWYALLAGGRALFCLKSMEDHARLVVSRVDAGRLSLCFPSPLLLSVFHSIKVFLSLLLEEL